MIAPMHAAPACGRLPFWWLLICLPLCAGCSKKKSTDELIAELKSGKAHERVIAVRLLPERKADAEKVVPAMIDCLKDRNDDVRLSAAIGLGTFGEEAKQAIPQLQAATRDEDSRVRRAVGIALSRIDPTIPPAPAANERRGK